MLWCSFRKFWWQNTGERLEADITGNVWDNRSHCTPPKRMGSTGGSQRDIATLPYSTEHLEVSDRLNSWDFAGRNDGGWTDGRTDGRTDRRTDGWIFMIVWLWNTLIEKHPIHFCKESVLPSRPGVFRMCGWSPDFTFLFFFGRLHLSMQVM